MRIKAVSSKTNSVLLDDGRWYKLGKNLSTTLEKGKEYEFQTSSADYKGKIYYFINGAKEMTKENTKHGNKTEALTHDVLWTTVFHSFCHLYAGKTIDYNEIVRLTDKIVTRIKNRTPVEPEPEY